MECMAHQVASMQLRQDALHSIPSSGNTCAQQHAAAATFLLLLNRDTVFAGYGLEVVLAGALVWVST